MKRLNYKNFKKVHEDANSATLQHPEGHTIKIAKGPLSDHIKKQLGALPFANGGEVPNDDSKQYVNGKEVGPAPVANKRVDAFGNTADYTPENHDIKPLSTPSQPRPVVRAIPSKAKEALGYADGGEVDHPMSIPPEQEQVPDITSQLANMSIPQQEAPQGPTNPAIAQPQPQQADQDLQQVMSQNYPQQAMGQAQAGIAGQAQAEGQLGNKEAEILQRQQRSDAMLNQMHQEKQQGLMSEIDNVIKDVKDQKIDPNHFWNDRGSLGKVSTAIGLILGGMGSGLTGGPNMALEFLNKQIDRDIEGQRMQMGQKMNMLTGLQHQFGNELDATNMAKAMQAGVYASQLNEAAAKSKDPMAQARAQQASAQILAQYGPLVQQTALRQTMLQGMGQGQIAPERAVPYLVPQEHQKEVFSEIKKAQDTTQLEGPILENFDKAAKENTVARTGAGMLRTPPSVQTLSAMYLPMIHDAEGRVNEYEAKTLHDLTPQPGDMASKIAAKRQGLIQFMEQKKATPTANAYGIHIPKSSANKFNPR